MKRLLKFSACGCGGSIRKAETKKVHVLVWSETNLVSPYRCWESWGVRVFSLAPPLYFLGACYQFTFTCSELAVRGGGWSMIGQAGSARFGGWHWVPRSSPVFLFTPCLCEEDTFREKGRTPEARFTVCSPCQFCMITFSSSESPKLLCVKLFGDFCGTLWDYWGFYPLDLDMKAPRRTSEGVHIYREWYKRTTSSVHYRDPRLRYVWLRDGCVVSVAANQPKKSELFMPNINY